MSDSNFINESLRTRLLENQRQRMIGLLIWFRPFIQVNKCGVHESEVVGLIEDVDAATIPEQLDYVRHQIQGEMMDKVFGK